MPLESRRHLALWVSFLVVPVRVVVAEVGCFGVAVVVAVEIGLALVLLDFVAVEVGITELFGVDSEMEFDLDFVL